MLVNLHVKNLALIEEEDIEFKEGLNILSGETGAGKSIILGAMNMALGQKVQKEMLRNNESEAMVEVVFRVTDDVQRAQLAKIEVEPYDDEVILTRKITDSRSVAKINGETVPALKMKQVGDIFLDIHGQHEHQSLLHKKKHMELLDQYGQAQLAQEKIQLKECYQSYMAKKKELEESSMDDGERMRELSFLEHEVEEIQEAHLVAGEDEQLETDYRRMSNGRKIMDALSEAYQQTGDMNAASDQVGRAVRELRIVEEYDENISQLATAVSDIDNLLNDFNRDLSEYMTRTEFDQEQFKQVEDRLNEVNHLKTKYGKTIEDVLQALEDKEARINKLRAYDEYLEQLRSEVDQLEQQVEQFSSKISDIRKAYASRLAVLVQNALADLNFLDVKFEMAFSRLDHYTQEGYDDAEFMISTNPGEPMKPLSKVASGGEMSRIMLALKTVLAENDSIDTLIFDEIDSGISGRTAQSVSEKMSLVARNHQVICITHLPQIAAMADCHFLIEKAVRGQATISSIHALNHDDSIEELARMLGGTAITDAVINNAREMKELADQFKQSRK